MDINLHKSLQYIQQNNVENIDLDNFTTKWQDEEIELKPCGKNIKVQEKNKNEYIDLMC